MLRIIFIILIITTTICYSETHSLEKLNLIDDNSSIRLFDYSDVYFPSAFIMEKDFVSVTFRYFNGKSEMFNFDDGDKIHDADIVGNSILWSYNPTKKINIFAGLSTYYTNYSINENSTIVKDFDTTYRNVLTNIDTRLLNIPTIAPVHNVDRQYWKRHYGIHIDLYDFDKNKTKIMTGFVQYHNRYQRKTLDIPVTTTNPALALIGPVPRTLEDIIYAVENSEVRLWASKHFNKFDLHGGLKVISTETKIDNEKAEFYTNSTLFGRIDYFFNKNFIFKFGADKYGLTTNFNYFRNEDFIFSLFYFKYDDDIKGKSSITGYEDVHFVRKEKITGITYTKRF